jgi:multidrug efflux pump
MIPLSTLRSVERIAGPDTVDRFNIFPSAKILGNPAPGFSWGQSLAAMQDVVSSTLATDYSICWTGSAYQEISTAGTGYQGFIFGLIMVFLILAAQYERWSLPLAMLTAVPFALFGPFWRSGCEAWRTTSISRSGSSH